MTKDQIWALKCFAWLLVTGLSWLYAARGYSSTPRFDLWFWGLSFWFDMFLFALAITAIVLRWEL